MRVKRVKAVFAYEGRKSNNLPGLFDLFDPATLASRRAVARANVETVLVFDRNGDNPRRCENGRCVDLDRLARLQ
jgi:hypothetical protein